MLDLQKNWPVYVLLTGVIVFFAYVIIKSRRQEKSDKKFQNK